MKFRTGARFLLAGLICLLLSGIGCFSLATDGNSGWEAGGRAVARGRVFLDANRDRKFGPGENGLAGIRVSNGLEIVRTDASGNYSIPIEDGGSIFVIKPRGLMTPVNEWNLPRFFYLHKPDGSPKLRYPGAQPTGPLPQTIDFPLHEQEEPDQFEVLLFGDPQPRNAREVDYIAHDVVKNLIGSDRAFGVTLGDIVFDDLSVMEPLNQTIALIGIPWYNVMGNHDINTDVATRDLVNETFERHYGPSYYSYDHGPVHFVVMDNIGWVRNPDNGRMQAAGQFGDRQLQFLKNDLALIPPDQLVVIMMHIPLSGVRDTVDFFQIIEDRPLCISISAHTHTHEHRFFGEAEGFKGNQPHHHIVNVTVSGSWWSGKMDERGIPHSTMSDGAPNGYSVMRFDGSRYELDFHATGAEAGQQMRIEVPFEMDASKIYGAEFFVNVFNGSDRSKVEFRIDGASEWQLLQKVQQTDPFYADLQAEDEVRETGNWHKLSKPSISSHLWSGSLPAMKPGVHLIECRTTDMHGREFTGHKSLRVTGVEAAETIAPPEENGSK